MVHARTSKDAEDQLEAHMLMASKTLGLPDNDPDDTDGTFKYGLCPDHSDALDQWLENQLATKYELLFLRRRALEVMRWHPCEI